MQVSRWLLCVAIMLCTTALVGMDNFNPWAMGAGLVIVGSAVALNLTHE